MTEWGICKEAEKIMRERFGKDNVIALATSDGNTPSVRYVNAFYDSGSFYIITYALSGKMRQLSENHSAAIAGEWFTAHGIGENLGYFGKNENADIAEKLRKAFAEWIDNGHNNFDDENTVILRIRLTDGVLMSHGKRFELKFSE